MRVVLQLLLSRGRVSDFIHESAEIEEGVTLGPDCYVGENVRIGSGTELHKGAIVKKDVAIGKDNRIHSYAVIGDNPQERSYEGKFGRVKIGDGNVIREFVTIHRPVGVEEKTEIGNSNYLMAYAHVGHNARIGSEVLLVNGATLGGYCQVEDHAYISAFVPVHQWARIGAYSLIGGGFRLTKDLIPFALAAGSPLRIVSPNFRGLRKHKFSSERIEKIKEVFRVLFRKGWNTTQALERLEENFLPDEDVEKIIEFIESSKRGIVK